jgi:hypothetical protein
MNGHNDSDGDAPNLNRRDYLRLTGATTASLAAGVAATGTASAGHTNDGSVSGNFTQTEHDDYMEITVASGSIWDCDLSSGDTLSNYLIDVSADGAGIHIRAFGDGWEIRNFGITGVVDDNNGYGNVIHSYVPGGGSALIENCYFGEGSVDQGASVMYTDIDHAGTLTVRDMYLRHWEEGLYCSAPGIDSGGGGGVVQIENCYARNNNVQQYRLGTDGSYVQDSVAHVDGDVPTADNGNPGYARGVWAKEGGTIEIRRCDVLLKHDEGASGIYEGDNDETGLAQVRESEVETCCGAGPRFSGNVDVGSNVGSNPDVSVPSGVPTTAEGAASGSSSGGGGGGGTTEDDRLEIVAASDAESVNYAFDVYGSVSKVLNNGDNSAEDSDADTITDNGDGTYTVEGVTGNGYGDTYDFDGNVFSWSCDHPESNYTLQLNGSTVTPDELTKDRFEIVAASDADSVDYSFTVDGTVSKVLDNGDNSAEDSDADTITDNGDGTYTVEGVTGNGYGDTYDYDGTLSDWWSDHADSDYSLYVNGSEIQPEDIGGDGGSSATVLDDFEDGDLSEYAGHTGGYQVQGSTVIEGSNTLEATSTYNRIGHTEATTSRGNEYRCRIQADSGSGSEPSLLVSSQDPSNPFADCYWAHPDASAGQFKLVRRDGGSSTVLDSTSLSFQEGTDYEVAIKLGSDTVKAVLYDGSGNVVVETNAVSDATYSGGTFGFYTGGGTPGYYDYVSETPL